jgi:8-oxo-dGTP diphosphatase
MLGRQTDGRTTLSREYPARPIVAVGCVAFRDDCVLLARRGKPPGYGTWTIPGGAVKLGERLREAAARETREECSVEVDVGEVVDVIDRVLTDPEGRVQYHYVIVDYLGVYRAGDLCPASDCLDARWVPPHELADYDLTPAAQAVIAKARRLLAARPLLYRSDADDEPARGPSQ